MRSKDSLFVLCRICIFLGLAWVRNRKNAASPLFVLGFMPESHAYKNIRKPHNFRTRGKIFSIAESLSKDNQQRKRLVDLTPSGRVQDPDSWLRMCSDSLQRLTGKPMISYMEGVESIDDVHTNKRHCFLSHGSQDDPVYCYFNQAALTAYQYPESEVYQLPSRYSARQGNERSERQTIIDGTAEGSGVYLFPKAIRVTKNGDLLELQNVLLWNVYDEEGFRVGQAAIFDYDKVVQLGKEE